MTGAPAFRARPTSAAASAIVASTPLKGRAPLVYSHWQSISTSALSARAGGVAGVPAICRSVLGSLITVAS